MSIRRLTTIPLFTAIIIVCTVILPPIPVPILNINVTLQTFVVMLAGLLLSPIDAFTSILLYVLIGALGFPVFSGLTGGIGIILGPSGGFIISFPVVAYLISRFNHGKHTFTKNMLLTILFGIILTYFFGSVWMHYAYINIPFNKLLYGMLIFIPIDVVKAILASTLSLRLERLNIIYPNN